MALQTKLGRQGLKVSRLGLGCMGMSQWYGAADEQESIATIHRALELGVNLLDTAEAYGAYTNEMLIGKALEGRRDQAIIATKFGFDLRDGHIVGTDSRPTHIVEVVDASLKRLNTDRIDILYQHRLDQRVPIEDVVGTMSRLVEAGKVLHIGLCEVGVETIRRAHEVHPLSVVQSEFSLWERNLEDDVLPLLRELGIGLVGFCPLGRGFLAGGVHRAEAYPPEDFRSHDPRLQGDNYDHNVNIAAQVGALASSIGVTPAQLAIAWVMHQGDDIVAIPGTKRRSYLEQNVAAADLRLTSSVLSDLDRIVKTSSIAGSRYNERMMAMIDR